MALFTGKGDDGTTYAFGCDQRFSKSSSVADALGALDESNSYLGLVKLSAKKEGYKVHSGVSIENLISEIQQNMFIIQAEVAGADKTITEEKVTAMSNFVNEIEKELPPISSFFVSGGTDLSSLLDFSRTMARRSERRVVGVSEEGKVKVGEHTLAYLNRLSSLLYALARLANHLSGIKEESPHYK